MESYTDKDPVNRIAVNTEPDPMTRELEQTNREPSLTLPVTTTGFRPARPGVRGTIRSHKDKPRKRRYRLQRGWPDSTQ